jgi:hypothetical protein
MTTTDNTVDAWEPVYTTAVQCAAWVDDPAGWRECKNHTKNPSGMCRVHEGQEFPA